jgi:2-haloacid dehalogenase
VSSHIEDGWHIEAVVFDLGGVLLDWDPRHLYRTLFDTEDEMERFLAEICTPEWHDAHDRGVPTNTSCAELAARYPGHADLIRAWSERSEEMIAGSIQPTVQILRDLKMSTLPCYALTNMESETYPIRRQRFPFLTWFDGTVVSGQEGLAKPDREIFDLLLNRYRLTAASTLMIDDRLENLDVAKYLGMSTHHFRSPGCLRRCLESLSLLPPTGARDSTPGSPDPSRRANEGPT